MTRLNLEYGVADWRSQIKKNQHRSRYVIATFILIYLLIGLIIDLYMTSGHYHHIPLTQLLLALITFKITPWVTLIAVAIAVIAIWITLIWHNRLMLLGTDYREITKESANSLQEKQLYNIVEEMGIASGISMPKIFIIDADYMNAFASGYSEKSAMVAITRGLLAKLDRDELTAVMAHELSHIRHLDIKLTLLAVVLSNITLIMVDLLFWGVIFGGRSDREENGGRNILFLIIIILRYLLPLATVLLMLYLSRSREYMADAGCVELMRNNEPLARALLKIQADHVENKETYSASYANKPHESLRSPSYLFDPLEAGIESTMSASDFFSTHPNLKKRLSAIGIKIK